MNTEKKQDRNGAWQGAELAGTPVDLAPWTYQWRADRDVQPQPEAYFIPRRLERLDRVYRTAHDALPPDQLKSIYYDMPDLLKVLPPKPRGRLQVGLLWTGGLNDYRVELHWPAGKPVPAPEAVEVRSCPTSFGWFGFTVDRILAKPTVSADGRVWTYHSDPTETMDSSYNAHPPAATEMVAVFCEPDASGAYPAVPEAAITGPNLGNWQRMDVEVEWGFEPGAEGSDFDGRIEPDIAQLGPIVALPGDAGTTVAGKGRWRSQAAGGGRRGIVVPLLVALDARPGLESRITIRTKSGAVTVGLKDVEKGPVYIPRSGLFVAKAGSGQSARAFVEELAAKGGKSLRQMTREHREPASFEELMREVRLWTVDGATLKPFPAVPDTPMRVRLSDEGWTNAWRCAANQLTGAHMWGGLAFEVARVTHTMEQIGLREQADHVYQHFLDSPGVKPDGDYSDGKGALEWATSLRHDMGYSHDGTHASTGRLLYSMAERCFLTGDDAWFLKNRDRLQAAADWIVRQRTQYMRGIPNREKLLVAGLMPPAMLGDYAIPSCDWHWYYVDNALALQGLRRFAEVLAKHDAKAAATYKREADAFARDLRRVVERDVELSPVRLGRDGAYHSYLPRMPYLRGMTGPEMGAPQFPDTDLWMGSLPLAEPGAGLDPNDPIMVDTLDVTDEMALTPASAEPKADARRKKGLSADDAWFWQAYSILPKASHTANTYLLQDDVPNFLRFWANSYASMVGADGKLWEHWHLGNFDACASPDNGTAGWFLGCFRTALVKEEGQSLWIARATPRAWLEQGKRIEVANAPTYFGTLAYDIASDVDHGRITAHVAVPSRAPAKSIVLRLRHPKAAPIRSVTVNGKPWPRFDPAKETITLTGVKGEVTVVAGY